MWEIWANLLLPKALKSCTKSNKSPNLVTLLECPSLSQQESMLLPRLFCSLVLSSKISSYYSICPNLSSSKGRIKMLPIFPSLNVFKGWFTLDAAVCVCRNGLCQHRDRKFSISLQKCNRLLQMHVENAVMWMILNTDFSSKKHLCHGSVPGGPWPRAWVPNSHPQRERREGLAAKADDLFQVNSFWIFFFENYVFSFVRVEGTNSWPDQDQVFWWSFFRLTNNFGKTKFFCLCDDRFEARSRKLLYFATLERRIFSLKNIAAPKIVDIWRRRQNYFFQSLFCFLLDHSF